MSPLGGHFCIRFNREEEDATVSPIVGPFCYHWRRRFFFKHCVTFTCHSSSKKKPGQYQKNDILPASAASQVLQNPGNTHRIRQSAKKNLANTPADFQKKRNQKRKKRGIAALSTIYNCFCRKNVTGFLEISGKDFNWRGDRTEDGEERAGRVQQEKQKSGSLV